MAWDITSLTFAELEEVERRAGVGMGTLTDSAAPKIKLYRAIYLMFLRREDPAAKWDDTATLTMADFEARLGGEPDPTPAPPPGASP